MGLLVVYVSLTLEARSGNPSYKVHQDLQDAPPSWYAGNSLPATLAARRINCEFRVSMAPHTGGAGTHQIRTIKQPLDDQHLTTPFCEIAQVAQLAL